LAGELELLDAFLLDLFLGRQMHAPLEGPELLLEILVLLVEAPELWVPVEQRLDQLLVFRFHSTPSPRESAYVICAKSACQREGAFLVRGDPGSQGAPPSLPDNRSGRRPLAPRLAGQRQDPRAYLHFATTCGIFPRRARPARDGRRAVRACRC